MEPEKIVIPVGAESVSGLLLRPANAKALYLFAHGAGTNMAHKSMASNAEGLAARGIATLRYNFLYTEKGSKRPDVPKLAHAAVRAAAAQAAKIAGDLSVYAGGRSFGGRMTSQAQADEPLPGVRGLALLGFPLHPAGKPGVERSEHLADVKVPMLFVSGSRDALAELDLLNRSSLSLATALRYMSSSTPTIRSRSPQRAAEQVRRRKPRSWTRWPSGCWGSPGHRGGAAEAIAVRRRVGSSRQAPG